MFSKGKNKTLMTKKIVRITDGMNLSILERVVNHITENPGFYVISLAILYLGLDPVEAMAFDLDAAISGITDPAVEAIDNHWGKGLMIIGATGAAVSQGDLKTRMFGFGAGAGQLHEITIKKLMSFLRDKATLYLSCFLAIMI